jgi:DNA-binding NarL/FixJ family response regulator
MQNFPVNSPSVLIAEDEVLIREALRRELEKQYKVVALVGNGREAVETVEKARPDVVLLDVSMPVMNGLEAAERITAVAPEVKVIMVTSHAEPAYVEEAFRRGAKGYVLKGRLTELYQAIREVLDGRTHKPEFPGPSH